MAVAFVAGTAGSNAGGAATVDTATFSFTSGSNGALVVGIGWTTISAATVTGVSLDPAGVNVALTSAGAAITLGNRRLQFFYGTTPATIATKLVRATFSDASNGSAGISAGYFTGATPPVSDFLSANGATTAVSVTIANVISGDAVMDFKADGSIGGNTIGANQTVVGTEQLPSDIYNSSFKLGANGGTMTWTLGGTATWFSAGVRIPQSSASPSSVVTRPHGNSRPFPFKPGARR